MSVINLSVKLHFLFSSFSFLYTVYCARTAVTTTSGTITDGHVCMFLKKKQIKKEEKENEENYPK